MTITVSGNNNTSRVIVDSASAYITGGSPACSSTCADSNDSCSLTSTMCEDITDISGRVSDLNKQVNGREGGTFVDVNVFHLGSDDSDNKIIIKYLLQAAPIVDKDFGCTNSCLGVSAFSSDAWVTNWCANTAQELSSNDISNCVLINPQTYSSGEAFYNSEKSFHLAFYVVLWAKLSGINDNDRVLEDLSNISAKILPSYVTSNGITEESLNNYDLSMSKWGKDIRDTSNVEVFTKEDGLMFLEYMVNKSILASPAPVTSFNCFKGHSDINPLKSPEENDLYQFCLSHGPQPGIEEIKKGVEKRGNLNVVRNARFDYGGLHYRDIAAFWDPSLSSALDSKSESIGPVFCSRGGIKYVSSTGDELEALANDTHQVVKIVHVGVKAGEVQRPSGGYVFPDSLA